MNSLFAAESVLNGWIQNSKCLNLCI